MPRLTRRHPAYRLHKASGQAIVTLGGQDFYLGPHDTKASRDEYDRLIAVWLANGRRLPAPAEDRPPPTVAEIILSYWRFAERHYQRDGKPTRHLDNIRDALRPLRKLYGPTVAADFDAPALKAIRRFMIDAGLSRGTVNGRVGKVRSLFRWAVEEKLIPSSVLHDLQSVRGLTEGREGVRETEPIGPVPPEHVAAVLPLVPAPVRAMIEVQALTGMRGGEVAIMRGADIDRAGAVWVYRPSRHKTQARGHKREIPLGPKAQAILTPWLWDDPGAFLFSPARAVADRNERRRAARVTPMTPSQARRRPKRNPKRAPRDHYDKNSYAQAIRRACLKAGIPTWHPHRLRHAAATAIRARYGLEQARALLGHSKSSTTEIYAQRDLDTAKGIMGEVG